LPSIDKKGVRKQNYQIYIPLFCHWIDYSVTHLLLCICASNVEIKPTLVVGFFSLAWLKTGADRSSLYPTTFSVTAGGSEPRIRSTVASGVTTAAGIAHAFVGPAAMFGVHFTEAVPTSYRDWRKTDSRLYLAFALTAANRSIRA
jgi:hypothetical protein